MFHSKLIILDLELDAIRSFLKAMRTVADEEYLKINAKSEAGEFSHYDDEANAYFVPETWEKIAIRATLGELNALVEWELRGLSSGLYLQKAIRKPKERLGPGFYSKIKEIIEQIENYYRIEMKDIAGYNDIETIRDKVNSSKHRKGFKNPNSGVIMEQFELSREDAFHSIDSVRIFFKDLWSRTKAK